MDTSIASVVSLKNSIISISHTVILIIGNCIIRITSRTAVAKMLLRLPSNFFPSYRLVVSPAVIENNIILRKSMGRPLKEEYYSDTSSDDLTEDAYCRCCVHCQRKFFSETTEYDEGEEGTQNEETFIMNISRVAECSTPNTELSPLFELQEEIPPPPPPPPPPQPPRMPDLNPIDVPPLRRITAQELRSVKLRPSVALAESLPKTPEVGDMLRVLRKRYAVMRFSFSSDHSLGAESGQLVSFQ